MEIERIANQLKRAFTGPAWHGPSVMFVLEGIDAGKAAAAPAFGTHSIWEIVLHIGAWETAALHGLQGGSTNLTDEEDWPVVKDKSEEAWLKTIESLRQGNTKLLEQIEKVSDAQLDQILDKEKGQTCYVLLHGVIQHDIYHAGQIAILRKS